MANDVYLASLDAPGFAWEGGDWQGNIPTRTSPFFPPTFDPPDPFMRVVELIEAGTLDGRQTDWGGWVAKVRPSQVLDLLTECYGDDPDFGPDSELPHLRDQLNVLVEYVRQLEPNRDVALVAAEG